MTKGDNSVILEVAYRLVTPLLIMFGIYVLVHGELSPGGGFQAGVILGLAVICERILTPEDDAKHPLWEYRAVAAAGLGTLLYALVGIFTIAGGGNFLGYSFLPIPAGIGERHAYGMLFIEIGVTICVMATVVSIFDSLGKRGRKDDDSGSVL